MQNRITASVSERFKSAFEKLEVKADIKGNTFSYELGTGIEFYVENGRTDLIAGEKEQIKFLHTASKVEVLQFLTHISKTHERSYTWLQRKL